MNAFEQVMYAATVAVEPDAEDLAAITVVPGVDEAEFRRQTAAAAQEIAELRRIGNNGESRRLAALAIEEYDEAFRAFLPKPAVEKLEAADVIAERMFRR